MVRYLDILEVRVLIFALGGIVYLDVGMIFVCLVICTVCFVCLGSMDVFVFWGSYNK